jgi:hypothetical protein
VRAKVIIPLVLAAILPTLLSVSPAAAAPVSHPRAAAYTVEFDMKTASYSSRWRAYSLGGATAGSYACGMDHSARLLAGEPL